MGRKGVIANEGVAAAGAAQGLANNAQTTALQAGQAAVAVRGLAAADASALQLVNTRVSDPGDYKAVGEAALFFETGSSTLSDSDKQALAS